MLCTAGCTDSSNDNGGKTLVSVSAHSGQAAEREELQAQITRFNSLQQAIQARLTLLPGGTYNGQVQATSRP
jgi:multiple sugar transport system substrate-binding protein